MVNNRGIDSCCGGQTYRLESIIWFMDCRITRKRTDSSTVLFGTLERLLLPFGLHHADDSYQLYTAWRIV